MTGSYTYAYPRPMLSVDAVVFSLEAQTTYVLLIQRKNDPFAGAWALPGGFVEDNEALADAAYRELQEETHLQGLHLEQFRSYGDPGRDPRGHAVSVVFTGHWHEDRALARAGDDAAEVHWFPLDALPELAFDHAAILPDSMDVLKAGSQQ